MVRLVASSSQLLSRNSGTLLNMNSDYTIAGWLYYEGGSAEQGIVVLRNNGNANGAGDLLRLDVGKFDVLVVGDSGVTNNSGTTLSSSTWYHCAMVRSGNTVYGYLNAVQDCSVTDTIALRGTMGCMVLGATDNAGGGSFMNGGFRGWKAWSRALSAVELQREMRQVEPVSRVSLYDYWPLATFRRAEGFANGYGWTESNSPGDSSPARIPWSSPRTLVVLPAAGGAMVAGASGSATATGSLAGSGALAATPSGSATATGALTGSGALASASSGSATATGALAGLGAMVASLAASATVTAVLAGSGAMSASMAGSATVTATADQGAMQAAASGSATVTGTLTGAGTLAASAQGSATVTGSLDLGAISSAIAGSATVTGALVGSGALAAALAGSASMSVTPAGSTPATAHLSGSSAATAVLSGTAGLVAAPAGSTIVSAALRGTHAAAASISGSATITAALSGAMQPLAFAGSATVTAVIGATGALDCDATGSASVTAALGWAINNETAVASLVVLQKDFNASGSPPPSGTACTVVISSTTNAITIYADQLPSGSEGDILYHDGTSWTVLAGGSEGDVLKFVSGAPKWEAP